LAVDQAVVCFILGMDRGLRRLDVFRTAEVGALRTMIDRTNERFALKPDWVAADTAYGSAENLAWLALERQILPFIPVVDKSARQDGTWSRSDFTWDPDNDRYLCPKGKELKRTRQYHKDPRNKQPRTGRRKYRASKMVCSVCPAKEKCCPKVDARSVTRERFEEVREFAHQCTASAFNTTAQKRRKKVEMLFAHLKRILGLGRLRLRGPCGVQDEFTLAATAQNLRKLAKLKPSIPAIG